MNAVRRAGDRSNAVHPAEKDHRRSIIWVGCVSVFSLALAASPGWATPMSQDVFTNFESFVLNTDVGDPISIGTPPDEAILAGDSFAGIIGQGALYYSGLRAWMVNPSGVGTMTFASPASEVEFWATANPLGNGNTVITAYDTGGIQIGGAVVLTPTDGFVLVSFSGTIGRIDIENLATNAMNAVDDFGFTTLVPEPGALALLALGALVLRSRRD